MGYSLLYVSLRISPNMHMSRFTNMWLLQTTAQHIGEALRQSMSVCNHAEYTLATFCLFDNLRNADFE